MPLGYELKEGLHFFLESIFFTLHHSLTLTHISMYIKLRLGIKRTLRT